MTIAIAESNLIPMAKALPGFTPVSMVECLASQVNNTTHNYMLNYPQNVGSPYATSGKLYDLLVGPNGTPANSNGVAPADRSLSGQNDNNSVGKNTASSGSKSAYIVGLSIVVLGLILVIL